MPRPTPREGAPNQGLEHGGARLPTGAVDAVDLRLYRRRLRLWAAAVRERCPRLSAREQVQLRAVGTKRDAFFALELYRLGQLIATTSLLFGEAHDAQIVKS